MIKAIFYKPITIIMLTITVIIFGIISLLRLPVTLMPSGAGDVLSILTDYSGVSPEQMERIVTIPIENAIGSVEGIKEIYSVSEDGKSRVIVYFNPGKNIDYLAVKIREAVYTVAAEFPRACQKPYVMKYDPDDRSIFILNLKCNNMSLNDLRNYAEKVIKKDLSMIDGISEINFSGGGIKEVRIDVDQAKLVAYGINITQLSSVIQNAYFVNSQGKILEYNRDTTLYTDARFTTLEEMKIIPVFTDQKTKKIILIKDIANVYEGYREKEDISRLNGEERVGVFLKKSGDANTLNVCNNILKYVLNNNDNNNKVVEFEIIYNQGEYIKRAIGNVQSSAIIGGIVAVIVLILFIRNIKAITIVSFSIPFSIILTFFLMYLLKLEINLMTLSGFALGIGMLLDNSVVMIEYLVDDLKQNKWEKSENAVSPIISSTLTTIAIFAPIAFLNYDFRKLYGGLALTVTFSLVSSIACAFIIVPAGYGLFHRIKKKEIEDKHDTRFSNYLEKLTMKGLKFTWRNSKIMMIIIIGVLVITPIIIIKMDKEYLDPASGNEVTAYVELDAGTSLEETERRVRKVEELFRADENITRVNAKIENWHADIDLKYKSENFKSQDAFIEYCKKQTDGFKDCFVHYEEKGSSEGRVIDIDIIGDNDDELRNIASESSKVVGEVPGIREVVLKFKEGKPSLTWIADRLKSQERKISIVNAGEQLRWAIFGPVALKYIKDKKEMDLRISYSDDFKNSLKNIEDIIVKNDENKNVNIKDIGDFIKGRENGKIYRKNKRKTVKIGVYLGSISLSKAIGKIKKALKEVKIKDGYYFDFGDILKKLQDSQTVGLFALFLSIFIIYCILAIQFESFILPFLIIPIIPISCCFSILVLFLLRMSLNLAVYIGLIILGGVVVNNTILLTEGFNESKNINIHSIYRIVKTRIKPVYITTLTTIIALIPMVFQFGEGSELWRPLAITLVSGLTFGTIVNLCFFPVLFMKKK